MIEQIWYNPDCLGDAVKAGILFNMRPVWSVLPRQWHCQPFRAHLLGRIMETKICTQCGRELLANLDYFRPEKRGRFGLYSQCRTCENEKRRKYHKEISAAIAKRQKEYHKKYYIDNVEKIRARARKWHHDHLEHVHKKNRSWRKNNHERKNEINRIYAKNNREKLRQKLQRWRNTERGRILTALYARNRRATIKFSEIRHTFEDIQKQYQSQKGLCWWCSCFVGNIYHVDHIVPLSRGGSNGPENIVIACPTCNVRKNSKLPFEWIGRLF